ncbi:hypothetical protein [Roseibium sp. MMSF_3544]|uniref:hypothetical protein n=1 Tax=unclassified Roseibium TaxID=2629323 RepID=UPI0035324257
MVSFADRVLKLAVRTDCFDNLVQCLGPERLLLQQQSLCGFDDHVLRFPQIPVFRNKVLDSQNADRERKKGKKDNPEGSFELGIVRAKLRHEGVEKTSGLFPARFFTPQVLPIPRTFLAHAQHKYPRQPKPRTNRHDLLSVRCPKERYNVEVKAFIADFFNKDE